MKCTASLTFAAAVIGILATAPTVSSAADTKIYSGIGCRTESANENRDLRWQRNKLVNNHATDIRTVYCPVITDQERNINGADFFVSVQVPAGEEVNCTATSYTNAGSLRRSSSGSFAAPATGQPVNGEVAIEGVNISARQGYYVLECQLPAKASIYSYRVEEN
jgi:hypothetical protein